MSFLEHGPKSLPTIKELFSRTWGTYKRRVRSILAIYLFSALVAFGVAVVVGVTAIPAVFFPLLFILPAAVAIVAMVVLGFVLQSMTLEAAIHDSMTWKHAWEKAKKDWTGLLWTNLIAGLIASGAFLLFVIPVIILLPALQVFQYAFKIDGKKDLNALMYAHSLVRGRWWKTAGRIVLFAVLVGIIPTILDFFIPVSETGAPVVPADPVAMGAFVLQIIYGLLIAGPLGLVFGVELYHDLKTTTAHISDEHVKADSKKWGWIAIAGALLFVGFFGLMAAVVVPFMSEALSGM